MTGAFQDWLNPRYNSQVLGLNAPMRTRSKTTAAKQKPMLRKLSRVEIYLQNYHQNYRNNNLGKTPNIDNIDLNTTNTT